MRSYAAAPVSLLVLLSLSIVPCRSRAVTPVQFDERAVDAGIDFIHDSRGKIDPDTGNEIQDFYGPGVAWADINHDRYPDLIVGNGAEGNRIYLNDRDGTFTEVGMSLGLDPSRVANGVSLADVDNNGTLELVFANFYAEPQFYFGAINSFQEVGASIGMVPVFPSPSGSDPVPPESMGVAFGDYNADGFVDLYLANYLEQSDLLYRNAAGSGMIRTDLVQVTDQGYGFGGAFWDFDNDGDQDIFVANDFGRNFLFENQGASAGWAMVDMAAIYKIAGGASSMEPKSMSMGVAMGDYDNDQDLDLYVTNYVLNALYENLGPSGAGGTWRFRERAAEAGVEFNLNCWGVDFADFDLDGDLDLIQNSGYIPATMEPFSQPIEIPNKFWLNDGAPNWTFTDVSAEAGFDDIDIGRGLACADYDRDGDLDVVITNNTYWEPSPESPQRVKYEGRLELYENLQQTGNHWVIFELEGAGQHGPGDGCNRSAIGARVILAAGGVTQIREVQAGSSFLSQNSLEVEFGLGANTSIASLQVRWPCGRLEAIEGAQVDRHYLVREGDGTVAALGIALLGFEARPLRGGIEIEWLLSAESDFGDVSIYRAPASAPAAEQVVRLSWTESAGRYTAFDDGVEPGVAYIYRLVLRSTDGTVLESAPVRAASFEATPGLRRAHLGQNYPNPFNPSTVIEFELPRDAEATLRIFDARGRMVRTLSSGLHPAGKHRVDWDGLDDLGRAVASGVYHYALESPDGGQTRSMVLVR